MKRIGIIYQYHLDRPLNDRKPSRHYTGFCELGRLGERDATHRKAIRRAHNQNGELVYTGARTVPSERPQLSNSTHNAPRHDPEVYPLAQPAPGQGQPNGPAAPTIGRRSPDGAPDF